MCSLAIRVFLVLLYHSECPLTAFVVGVPHPAATPLVFSGTLSTSVLPPERSMLLSRQPFTRVFRSVVWSAHLKAFLTLVAAYARFSCDCTVPSVPLQAFVEGCFSSPPRVMTVLSVCDSRLPPLSPEDGHDTCPLCLGVEHLKQALTEDACTN